MNIFIDASALVSMLALEEGDEGLADVMDDAEHCLTSSLAIWEATIALSRPRGRMLDLAIADISAFVAARGIAIVPIGEREGAFALDAHRRFGKGRHPAGVNFGDCFAYACAKTNNARLLYKGDDFTHTDLA
jgi:ribonuclease VapC